MPIPVIGELMNRLNEPERTCWFSLVHILSLSPAHLLPSSPLLLSAPLSSFFPLSSSICSSSSFLFTPCLPLPSSHCLSPHAPLCSYLPLLLSALPLLSDSSHLLFIPPSCSSFLLLHHSYSLPLFITPTLFLSSSLLLSPFLLSPLPLLLPAPHPPLGSSAPPSDGDQQAD